MPRDRGVTPLWLQGVMGCTAMHTGYVAAPCGVLCMAVAPAAALLSAGLDPLGLTFLGAMWMGAVTWCAASPRRIRAWDVGLPLMGMGLGKASSCR